MTQEQKPLDEDSSGRYSLNSEAEQREKLLAKFRKRYEETGQILAPGEIYACTEPEFVGVMPVRTELTVLPADDIKDRKIGWTVGEMYNGCEVYLLDSNEIIKSRWGLRPGMKVQAWNMEWTVIRTGFFSLDLERENSIGVLEFNKDDRKCWTCPVIINKKVLGSFNKSLVSRIVGAIFAPFDARKRRQS